MISGRLLAEAAYDWHEKVVDGDRPAIQGKTYWWMTWQPARSRVAVLTLVRLPDTLETAHDYDYVALCAADLGGAA